MRLRARLVLALFATAAASLAVAAVTLLPPLQARLRADAARTLQLHGEAARPEFAHGHPRVARVVHDLARTSGAEVILISHRGVVQNTDPDDTVGLADARRVLISRHSEHEVSGDVASAAVPVRVGGRTYAVALRKRLGDVERTVAVVEAAFAAAAGAGLLLALAGGLLLSGRMLRRVNALRDAVSDDAPVQPDAHRDEIGELARAFAALQTRVASQETARRTFVATASHELRTPLASLQTLLELVSEEAGDDEPDMDAVRADIDSALTQARRLGGLAHGLLDLSRLDAEITPRSEPIELGELVRAVAAEFRPSPAIDAERCWALGDPDGVARIVRLLVDNAYRHGGGVVEVRTERRSGVVVVRVLDGGPGVPDEERDAIFERFRRGEASASPGFGLGLAIGRELARRMGGELALEDGPGGRFALALPAAPADVEAQQAAEPMRAL
ncbi:sensor histidine kinase [Candidatus Solirubrobacter pratensis]|uniref:sensor histidine kinase n=1 Tax=Candidatus Solirubrobacter pratensis TaxID=1298857 RepID=UPI000419A3F9|nr:HAMP domain-containing sensor histidine kinase [Candidatus Solirubrobacter pratensis]